MALRGRASYLLRLSRSHHRLASSISYSPFLSSGSQRPCSAYTPSTLSPAKHRYCSSHHNPPEANTSSLGKASKAAQTSDETKLPADSKTLSTVSPSSNMADTYSVAFESNSKWRRSLAESQPELFEKLGKGQSPQILWIGCADSRCPETTILGLQPGDIFTHRNIANILVPTDLNSLSVIQYAVQYLKVQHIIVCGHTSCGGILAALDNKKLGLIDTWLMPLRLIRQQNAKALEALDDKERVLKMVDLNVRNSVKVLLENPVVIDAIVERGLQVHGVIYNVGSGELNELEIADNEDLMTERHKAFSVK